MVLAKLSAILKRETPLSQAPKDTAPNDKAPTEKLQKAIARTGMASRREAERWIQEGRIKVNGKLATIGDRVEDNDRVEIDGKRIRIKQGESFKRRVIAYHKPVGEICSRKDPEGRPTVFDRLPKIKGERWIAIGRLDYNTSGLLLFTNDGGLANKLMHPSSEIDREYLVRVMGEVDEAMMTRLRRGVELEDGIAAFSDIQHDKRSEEESINQWFSVCLMEGRNREVRRLWESQGVTVSRLKRVRFGPIFLTKQIRQGKFVDLGPRDIRDLEAAATPKPKAEPKPEKNA